MKSHLPTSNAAWSKLVKSNIYGLETVSINRFVARYRLAKSFKGMEFEGYKDVTVSAYNIIFQLFLSFSAMDILFKGIEQNKGVVKFNKTIYSIKIEDESLLKKLKSNKTFINFLIVNSESDKLKNKLTNFLKMPSEKNLISVARACRNLTAHGDLSAAGSTAMNKSNAKDLIMLSDLILNVTDDEFSEFVGLILKS
jgi:hypothetical protein